MPATHKKTKMLQQGYHFDKNDVMEQVIFEHFHGMILKVATLALMIFIVRGSLSSLSVFLLCPFLLKAPISERMKEKEEESLILTLNLLLSVHNATPSYSHPQK